MTREEGIEFGQAWLELNEDCEGSRTYEFIKMAIKALEQDPCEDAISRQAVLDLAKKGVLVSNGNFESVCKAINEIPSVNLMPCEDAISRDAVWNVMQELWGTSGELLDRLMALPSVYPTKTGHWIEVSDGYGDNAYICECSECKDTVWVYKDADRKWNYCPNCGARMIESEG